MRFFATSFLLFAAAPVAKSPPSAAIASAAPTAQQLLAAVQKNYDGFADFSADFRQTLVRAARPGKSRSESGKVFLKRPGLMRWDYEQPEVKNFIIDGQRLWQYKPDDAQVMVFDKFNQGEVSAGLSFLWGKQTLLKEFSAAHFSGNDPLGEALPERSIKLQPVRPDPTIKSIIFSLSAQNFIERAVVEDQVGNFTLFAFRNFSVDQGLQRDAFLFVPPENVKVIHVDR